MSQSGTQSYVLVPISQIATEIKAILVNKSVYAVPVGVRK